MCVCVRACVRACVRVCVKSVLLSKITVGTVQQKIKLSSPKNPL